MDQQSEASGDAVGLREEVVVGEEVVLVWRKERGAGEDEIYTFKDGADRWLPHLILNWRTKSAGMFGTVAKSG